MTREVGIRLSVKDKELVERALKSLGKEGQDALQRIGGSADKASVSLQALDAAARGANRGMERLKAGVALAAAGLAAGFTLGIKSAIDRLEEMDKLSAQVDRALANTGNTAQTSAAELADFADQLELRTGRAAEEIMAIGGNLATFKFDHEVFYRSIELANDMSAAWGGELKQNLEGLSRALADPEKGFAMLEKRGISLTEAQGDLVARFIAINDLASAQRVILGALEADVKGVAEEGMTPLQRATLSAQKALEDLFEDLVRGEEGSDDLRVAIEDAAKTLSDPNVLASIRLFGTVLITVLREALEFIGGVAAGLQRVIDMFHALEGQSDATLEQKSFEINKEIVRVNSEGVQLKSALDRFTGASPSRDMLQMQYNEAVAREGELRAEDAQIRAILDSRKPTQPVTPPITPPAGGGGAGDPPTISGKDAERELQKTLREAERLTERMRTAAEDYAATLADLDRLLAGGFINQQTYNRAVAEAVLKRASATKGEGEYADALAELQRRLAQGIISERQYTDAVEEMSRTRLEASNTWLAGIELGFNRIASESRNVAGNVEDVLVRAVGSFEGAFIGAIKTGKFEWESLAQQILLDIAKMAIRQGVTGPVSNLIGSALGGLFGGGGSAALTGGAWGKGLWGSAIFSAKGNVFDSPGLSAYSNSIVRTPTVFPFAKGAGIMGEAGPEAILPLLRDSSGRLGVRTMGGEDGLEVNIYNQSGSQVNARRTTGADGKRQLQVMVVDVVRDARRRGAEV